MEGRGQWRGVDNGGVCPTNLGLLSVVFIGGTQQVKHFLLVDLVITDLNIIRVLHNNTYRHHYSKQTLHVLHETTNIINNKHLVFLLTTIQENLNRLETLVALPAKMPPSNLEANLTLHLRITHASVSLSPLASLAPMTISVVFIRCNLLEAIASKFA